MNLIFLEKLFVGHTFLYAGLVAFVVAMVLEMVSYALAGNALRESGNVAAPQKKWLKQVKQRYIALCRTGSNVTDMDTFLEVQFEKNGMKAHSGTLNKIVAAMAVLGIACSITEGMLAILFKTEAVNIFVSFAMGLWTGTLIVLVSFFADTAHKYRMVKNNIKNYFENELNGRINRIKSSELSREDDAAAEAAVADFFEKEKEAEVSPKEEKRAERINKKWQELEMKKAQKQQKKIAKLKKKMEKVQNSLVMVPEIERILDTPESKRREQKEALLAECRGGRKKLNEEDNKIITEVLNEFLA